MLGFWIRNQVNYVVSSCSLNTMQRYKLFSIRKELFCEGDLVIYRPLEQDGLQHASHGEIDHEGGPEDVVPGVGECLDA